MKLDSSKKPLQELIEIIHFTEKVSARMHGLLNEAEIYQVVREEFAKSKKYSASIVLLTDDKKKLRIAATSLSTQDLQAGEKASGLQLKNYEIDLSKSSIYRQVVKKGRTVQVDVSEIIDELFPRPLSRLVSKVIGYEKKKSILTPLRRRGEIIGVLATTSTCLVKDFIPSVKNLVQHISNALELSEEISERQKAEEALRKAHNKLRRLANSQREFIAYLSHELRGSLSTIKAVVEAELDRESPPLAKQLALVNKKVDQITVILENLMLVSRLDAEQEYVEKTRLKLKDLFSGVLQDVASERKLGPIANIKMSCSKNLELEGDEVKISMVLTNLLRNALAHHPKGKPRLFLKAKRYQGIVQIVVGDNNPPIPQKELKKIFKRFYFYQPKNKRVKTLGLGLGLYICQRLVQLMGGKIWAENRSGKGNRFVVHLPVS